MIVYVDCFFSVEEKMLCSLHSLIPVKHFVLLLKSKQRNRLEVDVIKNIATDNELDKKKQSQIPH